VNGQKTGEANKIYASSISYTGAGAIGVMRLGNNPWEHTLFNSRLQRRELIPNPVLTLSRYPHSTRARTGWPCLEEDVHNLSRLYTLKYFLNLWQQRFDCFDSIIRRDENYYCHACIAQVLLVRQILIGG
jgi:hypothetical protein